MHTQIYLNTENKGLPVSKTCEVKGCNKEAGYFFSKYTRKVIGLEIHNVCLKCKQTLDFLRKINKFFTLMRSVINVLYSIEFYDPLKRGN